MNNPVTPPRVMIVEDDEKLAALIAEYLGGQGFDVILEHNGAAAPANILADPPNILLLDLNLPGLDGLEICRRIRPQYAGPILMLTARDEDVDQILGLEMGADDYVIKPATPRLILARIHALLRRAENLVAADSTSEVDFEVGELRLNCRSRESTWRGVALDLTTKEFDLLVFLVRNAGRILTRDEISQTVRGIEHDGIDRWVDIQISRLRNRFDEDGRAAERIKTVWGKGYLFTEKAWQ